MRSHAPFISRIYFVTTLACIPSTAADDNAIQAEVLRPRLVPVNNQTTSLAVFKLTFDVRFTNRSENSANIPDPDLGPDGATWSTLLSAQSQFSDGKWKYVVTPGTLMLKGDTQFTSCKSLRPKQTEEIRNVSHLFDVYKSQLAGLDPKSTVRLYLVLFCREKDGTVLSKTVETDPFVLSIPAGQ